ncbi:MAG: SDR family NAD(P)-dependent oxidoreductase [Siphonobacter sp.]
MSKQRNILSLALGIGVAVAVRQYVRAKRHFDFRNKVILITGGSRGLGLVIARQLACRGAKLALCARDEGELARAGEIIAELGAEVVPFVCDLTKPEKVEHLMEEVLNYYGRIDALINNAGVIQVGPVENMSLQEYDEAMETHFYAPLHAIRAVLPHMQSRKTGRIVNISSIGGKVAVPHLLPYVASKFALSGLSKGLRAELIEQGIYVTTVYPGLMRTGSSRNAIIKGKHQQEYTWFKIADSLPLLSLSAETAAEQILEGLQDGRAEVVISFPAKLLVLMDHLFPELTANLLGTINRFLPGAVQDVTNPRRKGYQVENKYSHNGVSVPTSQAAITNNEL